MNASPRPRTPEGRWDLQHGHYSGDRPSPTYSSWDSMIGRCERGGTGYERYGAIGIRVCERWLTFANFLADMGERPSLEYQIERKDNALGYSLANCVWATRSEQGRNRCSNLLLTHEGRTMCASDWQDETGIPVKTIWTRKFRGWSDSKTLTTPRRAYPAKITRRK